MPEHSELRKLFDSLKVEADLSQLIADHVQEGLYLEFKQKRDRSTPDLADEDRSQFSRAVGGFANSDGGVMVWGIETNKREEAARLKPITRVFQFQALLKKSILNTAQPVVDDIQIEVIEKHGSSDDGYVKCLVPRSERTPHRSMLAEREYYKRTTEGFYRLEHFDLEDMFGRRPIPRLELEHQVRPGKTSSGTGGRTADVIVDLFLRNVGRGSARAPYIDASVNHPYRIRPTGVSHAQSGALLQFFPAQGTTAQFIGRSEFVVHPDTTVQVGDVLRVFSETEPIGGDLNATFRIAAENARVVEQVLSVPVVDLLAAVGWRGKGG